MNVKPGDLVLVKVDAWKGKRKIKDRWEDETWEVVHQIAADIKADAWKGKRKIKDRWEEETWEVVDQIAADIHSYEMKNQHGWS